MKFVITSFDCQSGSKDYLNNVMTKFIVINRTDALKADVNLHLHDAKLSNSSLSLVGASHKLSTYVSVRFLTMKINQ